MPLVRQRQQALGQHLQGNNKCGMEVGVSVSEQYIAKMSCEETRSKRFQGVQLEAALREGESAWEG